MALIGELTRDGGRHALQLYASGRGARARTRRRRTVSLLVAGVRTVAALAPIDERVDLYTGADEELAPRRRDARLDKTLKDHLAGLLIILERNLPAFGPRPTPGQRAMLGAVVPLCDEIAQGPAAENPYWRCIALSLKAECLLVLNLGADPEGEARRALIASVAAYAMIPEPRDHADDRQLFNRSLLDGDDPTQFVVTLGYLQKLVDEVNAA